MYARGINERTCALGGVSEANDPKPQGSEHNVKHNWDTNWKMESRNPRARTQSPKREEGKAHPRAPKPKPKPHRGAHTKGNQKKRGGTKRHEKHTTKRGARKHEKHTTKRGFAPFGFPHQRGFSPLWIPPTETEFLYFTRRVAWLRQATVTAISGLR